MAVNMFSKFNILVKQKPAEYVADICYSPVLAFAEKSILPLFKNVVIHNAGGSAFHCLCPQEEPQVCESRHQRLWFHMSCVFEREVIFADAFTIVADILICPDLKLNVLSEKRKILNPP